MSRIKIASIKTSSNQNRIIKTAQRAINISNACDIQGLYKHSSTFLDMAIKYASFITAQEEPKEEQRPNADEINWETLHQQNVHPELLEAYQEYNWNRQNYNQPREFLPQRKNVQYHFDESELQSAHRKFVQKMRRLDERRVVRISWRNSRLSLKLTENRTK